MQGFTDACPLGGGYLWGSERVRFLWSSRERQHHIDVLEAETEAILRMLRADASSLDHCKLFMWFDNVVTVKAVQGDKQITPPHKNCAPNSFDLPTA